MNAKWPFFISGSVLALMTVLCLHVFNDNLGLGSALTVMSEFFTEKITDEGASAPALDWQIGFLLGILLGALAVALMTGNFKVRFLADCGGAFTVRTFKTVFGGFFGGFLVMLGIQISGDSVFGHITSAIQLSGSAWVFLLSLVISGALLAILLERRGGIIEEGAESGGGASGGGKDK